MKACRQCKRVLTGKMCPVCKIEGAKSYQGTVFVFDVNSDIARKMGITAPGKYALKI